MDRKYRSIFSNEKEYLEAIREDTEQIDIQHSEKGIQMSVQESEENKQDIQNDNLHEYIVSMNYALNQRERQEKKRLKNMLKNKRISSKSYSHKKQVLEKWVDSKKSQIQKTKNLLFQGWMAANEIIGHLEKDKSEVFKRLESKRGRLSPSSQSSNPSSFSFCLSNNSIGSINTSNLTTTSKQNPNRTVDFDICNKLRNRGRPRPTHCKFIKNKVLEKIKGKLEGSRESDIGSEKDRAIEEVSQDSSPDKQPPPKRKDESGSLDWAPVDYPETLEEFKEDGYINQCISDIKQYYKGKQEVSSEESSQQSSDSSSFNMTSPNKETKAEENISKSNDTSTEKDASPFGDSNPVSWPTQKQAPLPSDSPKGPPRSSKNITTREKIKANISPSNDKAKELEMNQDLEDIGLAISNPIGIKSKNSSSGSASPVIDNTVPDQYFDDDSKPPKNSLNFLGSTDVPQKPSIKEFIPNKEIQENQSPEGKKFNDNEYDDPQLTPEALREVINEREEDANFIADQILHMMLCELDEDKGISKALNQGEPAEEMPSFLTRGIQSDPIAIAQYLQELFTKIKNDKELFLESLATPLNRDPLEILGHLQDIDSDSANSEAENTPFQQSVLPVELYLENEKQRRINKMSEDEKLKEQEKAQIKKLEKQQKMQEEGILYDSDEFDSDESIMAEWENIHNKVIFD